MGGKHFGELFKLRNIIYYRLSPFEQRAFAGAIKQGVPNILRRFRENVFVVVPRKLSDKLLYLFTYSLL